MGLSDAEYAADDLTTVSSPTNGNGAVSAVPYGEFASTIDVLDTRTIEILKLRRAFRTATRRRGWLVRRMLLVADVVSLAIAFVAAQQLFAPDSSDRVHPAI